MAAEPLVGLRGRSTILARSIPGSAGSATVTSGETRRKSVILDVFSRSRRIRAA